MRGFFYFVGFVILLAGLAWGGIEIGVPPTYVAIAATIYLGLGIITAASRTRRCRTVTTPPVTVVREDDPF